MSSNRQHHVHDFLCVPKITTSASPSSAIRRLSWLKNISSSEINNPICSSLIIFPGIHELKPEQILVIQNIVRGKDVFTDLPTGFGKSLIFQILPSVLKSLQSSYASSSALVIVVFP